MNATLRFAILFSLAQVINVGLLSPCLADSVESSETTAEIKAYAPKYQERIKTYEGQIDTALTKGWLTPAAGQKFKDRLGELKTMEANASKNGYPKPELDNVERAFTKFNMDLSTAETASTQAASKPASAEASDASKSK